MITTFEITTNTRAEFRAAARLLGERMRPDVEALKKAKALYVHLIGEKGTGKTNFVQSMAEGILDEPITMPQNIPEVFAHTLKNAAKTIELIFLDAKGIASVNNLRNRKPALRRYRAFAKAITEPKRNLPGVRFVEHPHYMKLASLENTHKLPHIKVLIEKEKPPTFFHYITYLVRPRPRIITVSIDDSLLPHFNARGYEDAVHKQGITCKRAAPPTSQQPTASHHL